jgi:DNA-binding protein H-NS
MKPSYKELKAQAEKLAQEAEQARIEEVKEVASRCAQELNEYQITLEELRAAGYSVGPSVVSSFKPAKAQAPSGMKYQNPADAKQQWTGRGRMPLWLKALVDSGQDKEKFKIA